MNNNRRRGQALLEYLLVCMLVITVIAAPMMDPTDKKNQNDSAISLGQWMSQTLQNNLQAWQFATRLAD